jgi:hypothetical protein
VTESVGEAPLIRNLASVIVCGSRFDNESRAGIGAGIYKDAEEAFSTLKKIMVITPEAEQLEATKVAYEKWLAKI